MAKETMLGIIILIFNSKDNVIALAKQIRTFCTVPYKVVIVDNTPNPIFHQDILNALEIPTVGSDDSELPASDIYYLPTYKNIGFAAGNNVGAVFLEKHFSTIQYLLFSNDDIVLDNGDVFDLLCQKIHDNPQIGCIGPRIVGSDGLEHSPRTRIISLYRFLSIYLLFPLHEIVKLFRPRPPEIGSSLAPEGECLWLLGAFMMFPRYVFDEIGMFDSDTFLFYEEIIIAAKLSRIGKINYFLPSAKVLHLDGASTTKIPSCWQSKELHKSQRIYFKKYKKHSIFALIVFDFSFWWYHHFWKKFFK